MRLANERDQAIVRSAVSDAAGSLLGFLPALGAREVFAFGDGVPLPTRLRFRELPEHLVPKSEAVGHNRMEVAKPSDNDFIATVVQRWRGATSASDKVDLVEAPQLDAMLTEEFSPLQQALARNTQRLGGATPVAQSAEPDSFFFPVDDQPGRPPRLRK
jgi:hypothetical protein